MDLSHIINPELFWKTRECVRVRGRGVAAPLPGVGGVCVRGVHPPPLVPPEERGSEPRETAIHYWISFMPNIGPCFKKTEALVKKFCIFPSTSAKAKNRLVTNDIHERTCAVVPIYPYLTTLHPPPPPCRSNPPPSPPPPCTAVGWLCYLSSSKIWLNKTFLTQHPQKNNNFCGWLSPLKTEPQD